MSDFGGAIGRASFQEPSSPDETSAPSEQIPTKAQPIQNPVAKLLAARSKKKQRTPAALAAANARARRPRQPGMKWGESSMISDSREKTWAA